ncbi:MAG TPA: efflux RND transporter periplasmic adaptor subunit [Burkholderiales bacterium]|nr:efflux RND transporter periplasmic adaptor subunit [Burkholderiales bacterium]
MGTIDKVLQVFLTCVLATAIAALSACGNGDAKSDVARPRLENGRVVFPKDSAQLGSFATEPVRESAPQQLRLSGRLVWDENRTVRLFPPFAGRVTHILVKAGDRVKPGQTLAVLASPDFGQAQADARRAKSDFALAEKNLSRVRELYAAGVSSRKEMITAEADYARAEAELARASGKIRLYGGGSESVDQNLALASPIDGIVVERNINPAQELRPDLQLASSPATFVITDPSHLWVQLDATESQLASLKRGQTVRLRSSAWPEESFEATVEAISDFIDPASRTVKVRGSVINRDRKLKGEMFVTAELQDVVRTGLQVSERALVLSGGRYYVFVQESPGRFAWNEVEVEGVRDGVAGVVSGVDLGQKVVVEGTLLLHRLYRQLAGGAPA